MKKAVILGFLAFAVLFTFSLSLAIAADTLPGKYAGKGQFNREEAFRGYTDIELTIFKKEGDSYIGEVVLDKVNGKGKFKGKKHVALKVNIVENKLVGFTGRGTECMSLNLTGITLKGNYNIPRFYKGEIELNKKDNTEQAVPSDIREKLASSDASGDED